MRYVAAAALLASLAACAGSTPTRFWTIEPVAPAAAPAAGALAPVQVQAVHVPLAVDRLEIVQHDAANRVNVRDFDRWSAPPGDLIRRALTQDLVARLPAGAVIYPDLPAPRGTRSIVVDVLDLGQGADGFTMQASWTVTPQGATTATIARQVSLSAPLGAGDVDAQTRAIGTMVAALADSIAGAVSAGAAR